MLHNERIKNLLDNIIADLSANRGQYVNNPGVDFTRDRKLPFETVVKLILSMKGNSLQKELYDFCGRDPETLVTSSAFVQQRDKLNENLFVELFHRFTDSMTDMKLYKGYRTLAVDGSDINIAYNENADTYIPNRNHEYKGYNQYHLNAIFDLMNKVYVDISLVPRPKADERKAFIEMLESKEYKERTLFIADRGYPSWNIFAHFKYKKNADYLIRVKNDEYKILKDLPMSEFDINKSITVSTKSSAANKVGYVKINAKPKKQYKDDAKTSYSSWDFGDEEEIELRIVRFPITDTTYETIFTSLPRDRFPIQEIKKLYAMRWGIETSFRELKYVIGLTNLHSKKDAFVRQEIYAKLTMYNFCERVIAAAVVEQDNGRTHKYQINYTMGMVVCLDFYRALVKSCDVYGLMSKFIEAVRPGRSDKRKMRNKTFVCFTYRVAA